MKVGDEIVVTEEHLERAIAVRKQESILCSCAFAQAAIDRYGTKDVSCSCADLMVKSDDVWTLGLVDASKVTDPFDDELYDELRENLPITITINKIESK